MQALSKIKEQRSIAADARKKSADLKAGMDIFSIPHPPYRELGTMEADVEKLEGIWSIVAEWEDSYSAWKTGKFKEIRVCCRGVCGADVYRNLDDVTHISFWTPSQQLGSQGLQMGVCGPCPGSVCVFVFLFAEVLKITCVGRMQVHAACLL